MAKTNRKKPVTAEDPASIPKKKMGRPSKYDPAMCDRVVDLGSQGQSKAQIAAKLEVTRETVDIWARKHPDFSDAIKRAHDLALAWWEDKGQAGLDAGQLNATAFIFQMKNRFRADYRDQQDHSHGVSDELGELLARIDAGPRNLPTS